MAVASPLVRADVDRSLPVRAERPPSSNHDESSTASVWETSVTWWQYQKALAWALGALGVGCVLYAVEKYWLASERRFLENPAEVMMRVLGVAHFLIGWLFLFSSPKVRSARALTGLSFWIGAGVLLCLAFAWGGGSKNPFLLMAFYSYFFLHDICDQAHLFQAYGEAPKNFDRFVRPLCAAVILLSMSVLVGVHLVHGYFFAKSPELLPLDGRWLAAGWGVLAAAALWTCRRAWKLGVNLYGSREGLVAATGPLLRVYGVMYAILLAGSLLGSVGLNFVILMHVTSWLVFVQYQLAKHPARARNLWDWLRRTPAGFVTLHLAVALVVLALMAVRVHVWQKVGLASVLLASGSFPFWSLMHISMAFWRGK
ncbi:MAG: hypothetical protein L0Y72_02110 [Gemmataceae bacterium]|nr:hypothetical protein [Gemmataceae bacterium]